MDQAAPSLGHNLPPLRDRLRADYADLARRTDELVASAERAPGEIADHELEGRMGDLVKLIGACQKNIEARRIAEKEPYLASGREVDGFFKPFTDRLAKSKRLIENRIAHYLRKKAAEERRRRQEEERAAREEAARLAAEVKTEADLDRAIAADDDARMKEKAAEAKPAELARTRSADLGSVSTLRTAWEFDIMDYAALDFAALAPYFARADVEKAIRNFIRTGGRELKGARIFEVQHAMVR